VETEFGRKTQIHQSSCNKDYSCLLGDCPSFVTVEPGSVKQAPKRKLRRVDEPLPEPTLRVGADCNIFMTGIGGTGVVTVNQLLGTAALLDGRFVDGLDQTGLSQKGGAVVSHLKLSTAPVVGSNRIAPGEADCLLAFDILTATAPPQIVRANPERTVAVVSTSQVPTGAMVASTATHFPQLDSLKSMINSRTRAGENLFFDAIALAEEAFGDHLAANMIIVGAAFQQGLIPISVAAIEQAIVLNGVGIEMNTHAFRLGRQLVARPAGGTTTATLATQPPPAAITPEAQALVDSVGAPMESELRRLLLIRVPELIAYQNSAYARRYTEFVARIYRAEQAAIPGASAISEAVARYLFKLMAYKDEYEVARLALSETFQRELSEQFGADARVTYQLHPPFLRALGWKQKIGLGRWFNTAFQLLRRMRGLRGTPFDLFGYAEVRRVERALIGEYCALIEQAIVTLTPARQGQLLELAQLPDQIRGYEEIKLTSVRHFRQRSTKLLKAL
jgi:indolepyruvate ferredoxin oxidoreductase